MTGLTVIASGKGGVGKTFLAVTLAHALARRGRRVLLVDADLGLANIEVQLGIEPGIALARAIHAGLDLRRLIRSHEVCGFALIGGSGSGEALAGLASTRLQAAIEGLEALAADFDDVLVDLPSGLGRVPTSFVAAARRLVVVGNNEPTTLTDNYAFIKLTRARAPAPWFIANDVLDAADGSAARATLARACLRFLDVDCHELGHVRRDPRVPEAIRRQMPYLDRSPGGSAAIDIENVAKRLARAPKEPW